MDAIKATDTAYAVLDAGFTPGGMFHADDVFSAALLASSNLSIGIQSDFSVPKGFGGIVFDIGGGEFDCQS